MATFADLTLTAVEGAESQIIQRLLAVTARAASAPPLVVVVATGPRLHLLLQDQPADPLRGGREGGARSREREGGKEQGRWTETEQQELVEWDGGTRWEMVVRTDGGINVKRWTERVALL